ncbi:MAG: tetratricopeptide repeat protein [Fimbriimonadales bacterium]|nr:tetratricopeptide repeat protein [Fimbriimonadales bacterium]
MFRNGLQALQWGGALAILVMVGALYAPTVRFKFVWDDDQLIYGRADYRSPARWLEAVSQPLDFSPNYFRPLALSSLLVQIWLWKDNPAPFHAANLQIHLLNTALVMALGLRLLRGHWMGLLAGALYGVHPALVESVAFVSSRYDLTVTLFLLLALWLEGCLRGVARLWGVSGAFLLALFCKEMALVFPLVLVLWQLAQQEGSGLREKVVRLWRQDRALYGALGGALMVYLVVRYAALGYWLTAPIGDAQIEAGTPLQHLLLIGRTLTTLTGLVLFPFPSITAAHHSELPIPLNEGWAWAQLGLAGLTLLGVGYLIRRRPQVGWLVAAGLVALLPVLNLRPLEFAYGIFTAERFLTFPLALFLLGLVHGVEPPLVPRLGKTAQPPTGTDWKSVHRRRQDADATPAWARSPKPPSGTDFWSARLSMWRVSTSWALRTLIAVWGVGLIITSAYNLPNWRDAETLWKWLTVASPSSPVGFSNLSDLYAKMGRYTEALEYAERAIRVAPRSGMGYVNKGVALLRLGDPDAAIVAFRQATEVEPENVTAWNNFAAMLSERGEHEAAERIIKQRVLGKPPQFMGHQALGLIYARRARLDLAEAEFRKAYALLPNPSGSVAAEGLQQLRSASKWVAAAHHWMNERNLALAEAHLRAAAQRDPDRIAYGIALARLRLLQGRPAEAEQVLLELQRSGYNDRTVTALLQEARSRLRNGAGSTRK